MSDILMAFATKAGSTEQVAAAIAEALRKSGNTVDLRRARDVRDLRDWAAIEKWAREISAIAASRPPPTA